MAQPRIHERRRVALYSHDTVGLGHLRRNLALASALAAGPIPVNVLLISGSREATAFAVPPGIDWVTLPALAKRNGRYGGRTLAVPLPELIDLRSSIITAALVAFDPDVLIVDKVARGVCGELEPALCRLRTAGRTRCVLGLRDVLDDMRSAMNDWQASRTTEAIVDLYDQVWVYGDPLVFDPLREYGLPAAVRERTTFTGYLAHGRPAHGRPGVAPGDMPASPYALCVVGGGQDGSALTESFAAAPFPPGIRGVVVAGPYMDEDDRQRLNSWAACRLDLTVLDFVVDCEGLIAGADAVVSMGGYNTVCELLAARTRAVVVPRVRPRAEQLVRAERLARRGLIDMIHPDDLTPEVIGDWLASGPGEKPATGRPVDLYGLTRIPGLVDRLLASHPARRELADAAG